VVYGCAVINRGALRSLVICSLATVGSVLGAGTALARATIPPEGGERAEGLSVIESLGLFLVAPLALFAVIALAVLGPSMGGRARRDRGIASSTDPVWVGGPQGAMVEPVLGDPGQGDAATRNAAPVSEHLTDRGARGGASGHW